MVKVSFEFSNEEQVRNFLDGVWKSDLDYESSVLVVEREVDLSNPSIPAPPLLPDITHSTKQNEQATPSKMTLTDFYLHVQNLSHKNEMRIGQATFNYLHEIRPDLANQIRGTDRDPFYCYDAFTGNYLRFTDWLATNWNTTPNTPRYSVIGGNYYHAYTGTGTFSSLRVVGTATTLEEAKKLAGENYNECGGLLLVIDCQTGLMVQ